MISPAYLAKLIEAHWARQAEQTAQVTELDVRRTTDDAETGKAA